MDKALAYGARDCGFKSHCVLIFFFNMEDQEDISADYVLSLFQSLNDNISLMKEQVIANTEYSIVIFYCYIEN